MQTSAKYKDKILIVDDSAFNRKVLHNILFDDYALEEAEDVMQAMAVLSKRSHEFSLILLDLVMPRMDGFEVLKRMNKYQWIEDLPVIIVSSETNPELIRRFYALGSNDFIRRPYEEEIVNQRIKNTLKLYAKQRRMVNAVAYSFRVFLIRCLTISSS